MIVRKQFVPNFKPFFSQFLLVDLKGLGLYFIKKSNAKKVAK